MSNVTDVILTCSVAENTRELDLYFQKAFSAINQTQPLKNADNVRNPTDEDLFLRWYGGTYALQVEVYIGAFNYLHLEDLKKIVLGYPWKKPTTMQLFVHEENAGMDKFYMFVGDVPRHPLHCSLVDLDNSVNRVIT